MTRQERINKARTDLIYEIKGYKRLGYDNCVRLAEDMLKRLNKLESEGN